MSQEQAKQQGRITAEFGAPREVPVRAALPHRPQPAATDEPTLAKYVWILLEGWPLVLAAVVVAVFFGVAYVLAAPPTYHADAVLQVEPKTRGLAGLEDLIAGQAPAETEMAIIRSRSSLNDVVDELGMELSASPRRFPLIGGAIARRYKGTGPAPAWFGATRFGWGGERLKIRRLDVPDSLLEIPLTLTAVSADRYRIADADGNVVVEGEVGKVAAAQYGDRPLEVAVNELKARPGTQFRVVKHRRSDIVSRLQRSLKISEDGRLSGILVVSLDGPDPVRVATILNSVAENYLRQNVDRKSAEAAQQLAFLESQLPVVKKNVSDAEAAYNKFLSTHGSVNLSTEAQSAIERSAEVERELTALELQRSELRQRFTENHPALTSLNEKMAMLRSERAGLGTRMQRMPEAEANSARLQNDLRVATELYSVLLNKTQELRVVKSGTVGNVRILDQAVVPTRPAWPLTGPVLAISAMLGLMLGVAGVFVKKAMSQAVEDAEDIEESTGLPVYATIPHSDEEEDRSRRRRGGPGGKVLASAHPQDPSIENLRSLRTSLQFALVEARNNVVSITGPAPGVGKSFICVNLAYVLATPESRVIVVDADLRRGRLHRYVGSERKPGVSDVLGGSVQLGDAIRTTENPAVDILPTGSVPPNAAELLASHRFEALVEKLSRAYAYVLIDTPPALAVTDAAVVARLAGVNLLVLRARQHSMHEITLCLKRFTQSGSTLNGIVLNDVRATAGRYGKGGRYQRYEYRSDHA